MPDFDVFLSSKGIFNVNMLGHMKMNIAFAGIPVIELDLAGSEELEVIIKLQNTLSSSRWATYACANFQAYRNDVGEQRLGVDRGVFSAKRDL